MSLVDPDNRRMPDHDLLGTSHERSDPGEFAARKAWLIARGLHLRGQHPDLFAEGDYIPLDVIGARKDKVVAFARRLGGRAAIVAAPRLVYDAVCAGTLQSGDYWGDTSLSLPFDMQRGRDVFSEGVAIGPDNRLRVADLFAARPFALVVAES